MNLAQLNVARLKYPFEDPRVADFADNLDRLNGWPSAATASSGG